MRRFLALATLATSCLASGIAGAVEETGQQRRPLGEESRGSRDPLAGRSSLAVGAVSHLLLPTSANTTGPFNAVFKPQASIFNAVNASYNIRGGLSTSGGEIAHTYISVSPGQTVTYNNILADLFGYSGGGAIDLNSGNSGYLFIVNSRSEEHTSE